MSKRLFGFICGVLIWAAGSANAQFTQSPADSGAADTLVMVYSVIPDVATSNLKFKMDLYYYNDANRYVGCGVGFRWDNPNMQMDSAKASSFTTSGFDGGTFLLDGSLANTNTNKRFQFGAFRISGTGILPNPVKQRWASYYFTLSNWNVNDSICLDTLFYNGGTAYEFIILTNNDVVAPYFAGHTCAFDTAYTPPSAIVLSLDSLHFSGVAGGANPATQVFHVNSDNANFPFTLTESIPWVVPTPIVGTTPKTINVAMNITGMLPGDYKDSILVTAPTATNTPQYEVITLHLIAPPPQISATPSSFVFNAIASGSNPPSKILTIKNVGASTLNWTVTKSQSWLGLAPTSGTDSGGVVVSIDITGLPTGTYTDTIVVTDPAALNNPVKRAVTLNLGSDLPSIVAPSVIYVVIPNDSTTMAPRTFSITNGGIGSLTFTLTESSPRLLTPTPISGSAPASISVPLKLSAGSTGNDYMDTLWITSPEATNSPYPVVFFLHYIAIPAVLATSVDTVEFTVYECTQGLPDTLPNTLLTISNFGLDFPQSYSLSYESNLFATTITGGELPDVIRLSALNPGLPLGVYYDTLIITAPLALGSPKRVIIKYTMSAGIVQPQAVFSSLSIDLPTQENEGPIALSVFEIKNMFGGCMPWQIVDPIPWATFSNLSGDVRGNTTITVDATGFPFGQYPDSFLVISPSAVQDSTWIHTKMIVWKFFGDVNYDKKLTIIDLVYYVNFLFVGGPYPKPETRVGDVNCDRYPNILDLVYMVNFLFNNGQIPCGNPFK